MEELSTSSLSWQQANLENMKVAVRLRNSQKMQLFWVALGIAYNAVSWSRINTGFTALSPTDPIIGFVFVGFCGLIILAGLNGAHRLYRFTAPYLALLLIYSGVGLHIIAFFSDTGVLGYASLTSWLLAVLINTYGATTLLLGSWLALRSRAA